MGKSVVYSTYETAADQDHAATFLCLAYTIHTGSAAFKSHNLLSAPK